MKPLKSVAVIFSCAVFTLGTLARAEKPVIEPKALKPVKPIEVKPIKPIEIKPIKPVEEIKPVESKAKGSHEGEVKVGVPGERTAPKVEVRDSRTSRPLETEVGTTSKLPVEVSPAEARQLRETYAADEKTAAGELTWRKADLKFPSRPSELTSSGMGDLKTFVDGLLKDVPAGLQGDLRAQIIRMYMNEKARASESGGTVDMEAFKSAVKSLLEAVQSQSAVLKKADGGGSHLADGFVTGTFKFLGSQKVADIKAAAETIKGLDETSATGYAMIMERGGKAFDKAFEKGTVAEADRAFIAEIGKLAREKGLKQEDIAELSKCTFNAGMIAAMVL